MKTPTRTLLASMLLCAPLIATAAPATLSPEQAFDLYARTCWKTTRPPRARSTTH